MFNVAGWTKSSLQILKCNKKNNLIGLRKCVFDDKTLENGKVSLNKFIKFNLTNL